MEIIAKSKFIRTSPRKLRLVAEVVKGLPAQRAEMVLGQLNKRAVLPLTKTIKSAIANAVKGKGLNLETLMVRRIEIEGGPVYKRFQPVSRGQAHSIKKRTSHIKVVLEGEAK